MLSTGPTPSSFNIRMYDMVSKWFIGSPYDKVLSIWIYLFNQCQQNQKNSNVCCYLVCVAGTVKTETNAIDELLVIFNAVAAALVHKPYCTVVMNMIGGCKTSTVQKTRRGRPR